jgi:hypothetical protein
LAGGVADLAGLLLAEIGFLSIGGALLGRTLGWRCWAA